MNFDMKEEILDIVNEKDEIIGRASYEKIHSKKLLHRVVSAFLINDAGDVLLQLRSKDKSAYPSHWSFSMGGHVRHGETYAKALLREAKEEVGVALGQERIIYKGKSIFIEHSGAKVIHELHEIFYDGPIEETTEEVAAVQFISWQDLRLLIDENKEKLHPQMVQALRLYWKKELGL